MQPFDWFKRKKAEELREQREAEEKWLSEHGGKYPFPFGFYLVVIFSIGIWLVVRMELGLPALVAPILELRAVDAAVRVTTLVAAVVWILWFGFVGPIVHWSHIGLFQEFRYGGNKERRITFPFNIPLGFFLAEVLIGVLYIFAWLLNL